MARPALLRKRNPGINIDVCRNGPLRSGPNKTDSDDVKMIPLQHAALYYVTVLWLTRATVHIELFEQCRP